MEQIRDILGRPVTEYDGGLTFRWEPGAVHVEFSSGRQQKISYRRRDDFYTFESIVAAPRVVRRLGQTEVARQILAWNRTTDVVGFTLDGRRRIVAWSERRAAALQAEELRFYLAVLATEADRFEFLLTGKDER